MQTVLITLAASGLFGCLATMAWSHVPPAPPRSTRRLARPRRSSMRREHAV